MTEFKGTLIAIGVWLLAAVWLAYAVASVLHVALPL